MHCGVICCYWALKIFYFYLVVQMVPDVAWGVHTRVVLDVGCGVAIFWCLFSFSKCINTFHSSKRCS